MSSENRNNRKIIVFLYKHNNYCDFTIGKNVENIA